MGTCGIAAWAQDVLKALWEEMDKHNLRATIKKVGCIAMCEQEVLVDVQFPGSPRVTYGNVTPKKVSRIVESHLKEHVPVQEWVVGEVATPEAPYPGNPFYMKQKRIVLKKCGFIDPESIDEYIAMDGYSGLVSVLTRMTPEEVIEEVKSGLRGRRRL
ncbi:MAG: hypothetical protein AB1497_09070 [Bacillota bacterium]